ncbi:MAG: PBSX family phage terminase large subunit, partial [Alphaproteobacteria bacterium]|nr:PBSX family phage terminase large subunit [Alphaproteobacteria bacterium]
MPKELKIKLARVFLPLIKEKKRIKLFYGGRGGGKSYGFADALLILGLQQKLLIACVREIQESIKDSVHKLLSDRIAFYQLSEFDVKESEIVNRINGTRFIFKGLRNQDAQKIKSMEGVDIVWIEEAQCISKKSWEILAPTIRKDGSEIWISMNRQEENDPLWMMFGGRCDERTLVRKVNFYDNPFCPEELKRQALECRQNNMADYVHIWEGEPLSQGAHKLIDSIKVREAMNRDLQMSEKAPLVVGLDIARFGDDATVFCLRRGKKCLKFEVYRKEDVVAVANIATNMIETYHPTRVFLDVGGVGGGVYDILKSRGLNHIVKGINFGAKAINDERYANRRAEMWDRMRSWIEDEADLVGDEMLFDELTSVSKKYDFRGRLVLEEKDEVKKRIGRSTDMADALALSFAETVYKKEDVACEGRG